MFFSGVEIWPRGLEVLTQLVNAEIARPDVMIRVQIWDFTVVCEFNFNRLPLHLRQKKIYMAKGPSMILSLKINFVPKKCPFF
jgi:hypothetical protein